MKVVAFDIETLGLIPRAPEAPLPAITCVCAYTSEGEEIALRMWWPPHEQAESKEPENRARALALLDGAEVLIAYNGLGFDIEFMRRAWGLDEARVLAWVCKCVDPLMLARHVAGRGSKMADMLALNGRGSKTAQGSDAITMARDGEWETLLSYCLVDAKLVYELVMVARPLRLTPLVECVLAPGRAPPRFRYTPQPAPAQGALSTCCKKEAGDFF